jgi:localization factor PodJL
MVAQVQRKLIEKGFNPGSADGQVGPRTRTAIREYRRSLGLEPSESIDTALMQQLGLSGPQLHPFQAPE